MGDGPNGFSFRARRMGSRVDGGVVDVEAIAGCMRLRAAAELSNSHSRRSRFASGLLLASVLLLQAEG
jgi:hypothetical protein